MRKLKRRLTYSLRDFTTAMSICVAKPGEGIIVHSYDLGRCRPIGSDQVMEMKARMWLELRRQSTVIAAYLKEDHCASCLD